MRHNDSRFLLLRYEDTKLNPAGELARLALFLRSGASHRIDASLEKMQRAIALSSPERMRELEKQQAHQWVLTKHTRLDKPFVRTAQSQGWRAVLSPQSVSQIESAWAGIMSSLGYSLSREIENSFTPDGSALGVWHRET